MQNWCIVQLPSTIEMHDGDKTREWTVTTTADTAPVQVRISEDKFCGGELTYRPSDGRAFRFEARGEHCGLTVSVSGQGPNVRPEALVETLMMLRRGGRWDSIRF